MKAMAEREEMMFEIVKAKLAELGPNEKIVLMGHNFHLSKESKSLWFADTSVPEPYAPTMWPSIGEYIVKELKIPTYSIWMVQNRGYQSDINCSEIECAIDVGPDSLGGKLASAGAVYSLALLPTLSKEIHEYFDRRLNFAVNSGRSSGRVGRNADLLFFVDEVTGLRAEANGK